MKISLRATGMEFEERDMEAKMNRVDLRWRGCSPREAPALMVEDWACEVGKLFTEREG